MSCINNVVFKNYKNSMTNCIIGNKVKFDTGSRNIVCQSECCSSITGHVNGKMLHLKLLKPDNEVHFVLNSYTFKNMNFVFFYEVFFSNAIIVCFL